METDFVASFVLLLGHIHHNLKVKVVVSNYECEHLLELQVQALDSQVEHLVSVVLNMDHFAVVHVHVQGLLMEVIEGQDKKRDIN